MNPKECRRSVWGYLSFFLLFAILLLAAGCSNPEKAKAEYLSRGEAYLKDKKFQEASIEFRNAVQLDDRLAAAHWGLARAYEGMQRLPEAFEELKRAVALDGNNLEARVELGNFYLNIKPPITTEADRLADEVLRRDPNNIEGHVLKARVLLALDKRDASLAEFKRAIEIDPQRVETQIYLAYFYMQVNAPDKAEEALRRAISINGRSALAHMEYGKFLARQNNYEKAEAELRRSVEVEPANRDARFVLASFYFVNRQLNKAEEAYKALAELDRDLPEGRAVLADFYAMVGRYDEAVKIYQDIVAKAPDEPRNHYRLGEVLLQRGDIQGASAQVDKILKVNKDNQQALLLRSRIRLQTGDTKNAIEDLKEVLKQDPRSRAGLYFMAEANFNAGQLEQARVFAGDLERFYPDYLPAKLIQVQISLAGGDAQQAQRLDSELLQRLDKKAPDAETSPQMLADLRTNALTARGKAELDLNDAKAAHADFEAAQRVAPNLPVTYVNLAEVALREGSADEAAQDYERALSIESTNFEALSGLLRLYITQKRFDQAHARIDQAIAARPNDASLHFLKGQLYGIQQDGPQAERELRTALEKDPQYLPAFSALGALYVNMQQPDRAIAEYHQIIERRPDDATTYTLIGMIEESRKNYGAGEENYRRALAIDPNSPIAANNLACLASEHNRGNLDEAVRLAQGVIQKYPDEPGFADTLGWVYYKKGLYAAAAEQLQKAVTKAAARGNDSALYHYHLGMALARKGDKGRARAELQKADSLSRNKEFAEAGELRKTLATL